MSIWQKEFTIEAINERAQNMVKHLGIEFTSFTHSSISAKMPVDHRTQQPYGILHGGASVVLAETMGSLGGYLCLKDEDKIVVGLSINANHIRPISDGFVYGEASPVHLGRSTQVWQINLTNEAGKLVCSSRLTLSVTNKP